jgi:LuxR family maltose regulon positive regulatory protein
MYMLELQSRALQVQVRMGQTERARLALCDLEPRDRERAGMRIAVAALALAEDNPEQALEELGPVIAGSAEAVHERWIRVEALLLDAAARERLQDRRSAEDALERALELAEPEGLLLPFMLWPVPELLERHPRHRSTHATLVATILDLLTGSAPREPADPLPSADQLSDAELRVVRYLPSNLSAPEIAAELFVSANTVRTHMRHIYLKLDAHNRSEAVARARELGLLAPGPAGR